MTHQEKVAHFEQLLRDRGYWVSNAIPPATRLLWRLGFEVPPPYFLSFVTGALASGIIFGMLFGTLMSVINLSTGESLERLPYSVLFAAVFFGLFMATLWRLSAKSLELPAWRDFPYPHSTNTTIPVTQPQSGDRQ